MRNDEIKLVSKMTPAGFLLVCIEGKEHVECDSTPNGLLRERVLRLLKMAGRKARGVLIDPSSAWDSERFSVMRASKVGRILRLGEPCHCHEQSYALSLKHPRWTLFNGHYMEKNGDGLLRPHSWLIDTKGRVVESSNPDGEVYLGRPVSAEEMKVYERAAA